MTNPQRSTFPESLSKLLKHSLLDREEELRLIRRAQQGDRQALDSLVHHNLKLVMRVAGRYARRYADYNVELQDLFSEGVIGLHKAIMKFDAARGANLNTYADYWIKQVIGRYLANQRYLIRVPINAQQNLRDEEAGNGKKGLTKTDLRNFSAVSLDQEISSNDAGNQNGCTLADICVDGRETTSSETAVARSEVAAILAEAFGQLTPREQDIIKKRFCDELSQNQVSDICGLTRMRVRWIEAKALGKLRCLLQDKDIF
ncbi:MAG: sigma-70 family RNA polymerase sigma factor [Patescibacteria group bacterium]|jgi:RNA polymerase primary sigma factor